MKSIADQALDHVHSRLIGSPASPAADRHEIACPDRRAEQVSWQLGGYAVVASASSLPSCSTPAGLGSAAVTGRIFVFYGDMAQSDWVTKEGIDISERDRRNIYPTFSDIFEWISGDLPSGTVSPGRSGQLERIVEPATE